MFTADERGSIVILVCDGTDRHRATYDDDTWVAEQGWEIEPYLEVLATAWDTDAWKERWPARPAFRPEPVFS